MTGPTPFPPAWSTAHEEFEARLTFRCEAGTVTDMRAGPVHMIRPDEVTLIYHRGPHTDDQWRIREALISGHRIAWGRWVCVERRERVLIFYQGGMAKAPAWLRRLITSHIPRRPDRASVGDAGGDQGDTDGT